MELKSKHWILTTFLACATIAIMRLPTDIRTLSRHSRRTAEEARVNRLRAEVNSTRDHLRVLREIRRLAAVAEQSTDAGLVRDRPRALTPASFTPKTNPDVVARAIASWDETVRVAFEDAQRAYGRLTSGSSPEGRAGISLMTGNRSSVVSSAIIDHYELEVGTNDFCFTQYSRAGMYALSSLRRMEQGHVEGGYDPGLIGACWFPARYGTAGGEIARWYRSQGASLSRGPRERPWTMRTLSLAQVLSTGSRGFSNQCTQGVLATCEQAFLGTRDDNGVLRPNRRPFFHWTVPGHFRTSRFQTDDYLGETGTMLTNLELEFGQERFRRFWKSELPVEDSFRAAFGLDVGEWVYSWATARLGKANRGPRVPFGSYLWGVGFAGLFVVVGVTRYQTKKA